MSVNREIIKRESLLNEAREKIEEAMHLIESAVVDMSIEGGARSYILAHLDNWANGINPYDHTTIPELIACVHHEFGPEEE